MEVCDRALVDRQIPEREADRPMDRVNCGDEDDRTEEVEVEVDHRGAACIARAAEGRQERGDTGADILTEDDRNGCRIGDRAGGGERLQDTDRSRGRLDQCGDTCADQNAQDRVRNGGKDVLNAGKFLEGSNCGLHGGHTDEEHTKADEDIAECLAVAALGEHRVKNADQHHEIRKIGRFDESHQDTVTDRRARIETQDLRGDGGTDIGAHDDADRLIQGHDAGVNEADDHNSGRRGRLDHRGDGNAHQKGGENIACHLFQGAFQLSACGLLEAVAHRGHTVQEQRKAACQFYDGEKIKCHDKCSSLDTSELYFATVHTVCFSRVFL